MDSPTKFGRWTVLETRGQRLLCRCDCGTTREVNAYTVRRGKSQSCGCLCYERTSAANTRHGILSGRPRGSKPTEYGIWRNMKTRCLNPNCKYYKDYGGRGITICPRWLNDFSAFLADMGPRPPGHSIDRINNDANYEPGNCRWATPVEQTNNCRVNLRISFRGETHTAAEWSRLLGVKDSTLRLRNRRGQPLDTPRPRGTIYAKLRASQ